VDTGIIATIIQATNSGGVGIAVYVGTRHVFVKTNEVIFINAIVNRLAIYI
jgi:hypothetical protein